MPGCFRRFVCVQFFLKTTSRSRCRTQYRDLPALRRLNVILLMDIDGLDGTRSNPVQEETPSTRSPAPQDSQRLAHIPSFREVHARTSSCSRRVTATGDKLGGSPICQFGNRIYGGKRK